MKSYPTIRSDCKQEIDYDLSAARQYLRRLAAAMREAADSPDPRVVYLGVQLARYQGAEAER